MTRLPTSLLSLLPALLVTNLFSQEARTPLSDEQEAESKVTGLDHFAAPMQTVSTNLRALEQAGDLALVRKAYRAVGGDARHAMVWTFVAKHPIRYRLLQMRLEKLRHARFQIQGSDSLQERYSKLMFYSPRIDSGADGGGRMIRDEEFQVWCYIGAEEIEDHAHKPIVAVDFRSFHRRFSHRASSL